MTTPPLTEARVRVIGFRCPNRCGSTALGTEPYEGVVEGVGRERTWPVAAMRIKWVCIKCGEMVVITTEPV